MLTHLFYLRRNVTSWTQLNSRYLLEL
jgi:hypothetical protein